MFWRKNLRPSLVSNPIFFSFLVSLNWFKNLWVYQLDIYKTFFKSKCNKTMTKELNFKIQNYNLISTRVNKPTTLGSQLTHCSFFCCWNKFCSLPFNTSNATKKFNLVKKWRGYGLFYVKGFIFNDTFVKMGSNFEVKLFFIV
jgi:hypothetical protein